VGGPQRNPDSPIYGAAVELMKKASLTGFNRTWLSDRGGEGGLTMIRGLVVLCALACTSATAVELPRWKGHLTTLLDAQVACTDMLSPECEPFLAEAVAVADVF
jgi:hypothetical protein